ncbi:MAG: hypothetical protein SGPRY_009075 [Prymnesium sp.]
MRIERAATTAEQVYKLVDQHFLDRSSFDRDSWATRIPRSISPEEDLAEAKAIVRSLGDRYSRLISRLELTALASRFDESGGLVLTPNERSGPSLLVGVAPTEGSPLWEAGISLGDPVLSLNGRDSRAMTLDQAEWWLSQAATVDAQVWLPRLGETRSVRLTKPAQSPHSRRVESKLYCFSGGGRQGESCKGYMRLHDFAGGSAVRLREELLQLRGAGADQMVLDLRGNEGGAFSQALSVAGLFLPERSHARLVVRTEDVAGRREEHTTLEPQESCPQLLQFFACKR